MRGSDPDAGLYWLARMLEAGEDPRFLARRLVILASEDVGMADPLALVVADAASRAVEVVGMPEAALNLAECVVYLATAPKSNRVTVALGGRMDDVRSGIRGEVPNHLRDGHSPNAARRLGETATATPTTTRPAGSTSSTGPTSSRATSTTSPRSTAPRPSWPSGSTRRSGGRPTPH